MKQRHFYFPSCPLPFANHQQGGMENSRVSKRSSGSLLYNGNVPDLRVSTLSKKPTCQNVSR